MRRTVMKVAAVAAAVVALGALRPVSGAWADETQMGESPVAAVAIPPPPTPEDCCVGLGNKNSHKCLSVADASTEVGAAVVQWTCDVNKREQHWHLVLVSTRAGFGVYQIKNLNSGKCVAVPDPGTGSSKLIQSDCGPKETEWLRINFATSGFIWFISQTTGNRCMGIGKQKLANGDPAELMPCDTLTPFTHWVRLPTA
jgi:hypothetical protein